MIFRTGSLLVKRIGALSQACNATGRVRLSSSSIPKLPEEINFEQFEKLRMEGKSLLLDVRQPEELREIGVIPSALNIPLGDVGQAFALNEDLFEEIYGVHYPEEDDPIVTFCMAGIRAQKAREILMNRFGLVT